MNILATAKPIQTLIRKGKKGEFSLCFNELVVNIKYANIATHANTIKIPRILNIDPNNPTIPNLNGFLIIRTKASTADEQKFLPPMAIWM